MSEVKTKRPVVLVFAGHDPSGGAGLQADIEAIGNNHCQAMTVVTALTAQNTTHVGSVISQSVERFEEQIAFLEEEFNIDAFKIGLVTHPGIIEVIAGTLKRFPERPVVLDPVVTAGTGDPLSTENIGQAMLDSLAPLSSVLTPNAEEAYCLSGEKNVDLAAERLLQTGCLSVLITSAKLLDETVINRLYRRDHDVIEFCWTRLPGNYHGSGCTLAASLSAFLARGIDLVKAVEAAQSYTWESLAHGHKYGQQQLHPDRYFRDSGEDR